MADPSCLNATTLLINRVDQRVVIDMLGWSRVSMTELHQHVVPELRREAAQQAESCGASR